MRTIIYGAACSLDGFIAGPNDELDWLWWSDEVAALSAATFAAVETIVMGRRTYEVALHSGTRSYPRVRNIVFSKTLAAGPDTEVEIVSGDAIAFMRELKGEKGRGICVMGGGQLGSSLLAADLIDEIGVNIHPILLGEGVPFLSRVTRKYHLEQIEMRALPHGCVFVNYRVLRE